MNQRSTALLAIAGAFLGLSILVFTFVAAFNAVSGDGMWDMMGDGGGMHPMMRGGGGPETTGSASGDGAVRIVDFSFQPTTLTVTPGTIVTWTNEDSAPHTATGHAFDTGRLNKGDSGSVTFETPGEYDYICTYHPSMEGTVVVAQAGSSTPKR
jgi:plastocyanin